MTDVNEAWTYQVSPKLPDGTLVNIRGKEPFGFKKALEDVALLAPDIAATIAALTGTATLAKAGVTGTSAPQEPQASNGFGTQPAQPPAQPQAPAPQCQHGTRTHRKGNGSRGEWQAFFCPTEKGTVGQCDPLWLKKGEPGWVY